MRKNNKKRRRRGKKRKVRGWGGESGAFFVTPITGEEWAGVALINYGGVVGGVETGTAPKDT